MKPDTTTRPAVVLHERGKVVRSRTYPETTDSSLMKREDAVFAVSPFSLHVNGHIKSSVQRAKGFISMNLSQPNREQRLLSSPASLLLFITAKKKKTRWNWLMLQPRWTSWKREAVDGDVQWGDQLGLLYIRRGISRPRRDLWRWCRGRTSGANEFATVPPSIYFEASDLVGRHKPCRVWSVWYSRLLRPGSEGDKAWWPWPFPFSAL